jgi:hypothetical protein
LRQVAQRAIAASQTGQANWAALMPAMFTPHETHTTAVRVEASLMPPDAGVVA